jgi:hypothetical protein
MNTLPVHVHVAHPDGEALIDMDGTTLNSGVPARALAQAVAWVLSHTKEIRAEWARLNNPPAR